MMNINEIFYSLQGEGYFTGVPAVFVRFSGCNLRCPFCDTDHSESHPMTPQQIVDAVTAFPARHVVITGGEPSLQLTGDLIDLLHRAGCFVQIETNGTRQLPAAVDWVTCSPKEGGAVVLTEVDELKVVYTGTVDVEALADSIPARVLSLQPMSCTNTAEVVEYVKRHPRWRLSLQTHKLISIP